MASILQTANAGWTTAVSGDALILSADHPMPDLPAELAEARNGIWRTGADGLPVGTGPFRIVKVDGGRRVTLAANEDHWAGRPFLDGIEMELGRSGREQSIDFELRRSGVIEIGPAEARRLAQAGNAVAASGTIELVALAFSGDRVDARVRQAIALSVDRGSMHAVLLQRQGEPAGGLLPQWLSGYEFLFSATADVNRARQALAGLRPPPLTLFAGPGDSLARLLADRIAVNAREAGVIVRVVAEQPERADARLMRVRLAAMTPGPALAGVLAALGFAPPPLTGSLDAVLAAERGLIDTNRVVPLFHLPDFSAWTPRLRTWLAAPVARDGTWRLAETWIEEAKEKP